MRLKGGIQRWQFAAANPYGLSHRLQRPLDNPQFVDCALAQKHVHACDDLRSLVLDKGGRWPGDSDFQGTRSPAARFAQFHRLGSLGDVGTDDLVPAGLQGTRPLTEPLIQSLMAEGGVTTTRMLEIIKQDALDKLINMEVIQQEAKKERLYPDATTQASLIAQAKQADVKPGQSFADSLKEHSLTQEQYENNVIASSVYRVMASKYMPQSGSDAERQNAFITWICTTRQSYDVKILLDFPNSKNNTPCASGLPSDIPLTSNNLVPPPTGNSVPADVPTKVPAVPPTIPGTPKP